MNDPKRPWRHLYNSKVWHRLRQAQLRDEPLCRMCRQMGRVTPATVVDHIVPHKGDVNLFHDPNNLQGLCAPHHNASKQRAEKRGVSEVGCDEKGWPLDAGHWWRS